MSNQRTLAIGDIHGCRAALDRVLEEVSPQSDDTIICLGDYVDRGPNSSGVIERLVQLQDECETIFLLGNHELMMRAALFDEADADFWFRSGGESTMASYGNCLANVPPTHIDFLNNCIPHHETQTHFFVHANYTPNLPIDRQPDFALFWEHLSAHMPSPHVSGRIAVVGHTPQRDGNILRTDHLICIDTYCYGGGWLTAMDIETGEFWQANKEGELREREESIPDADSE